MTLDRTALGLNHQVGKLATYHHWWVVPLFIGACGVRVDAVVDDLECRQADVLHGAEVRLPEPAGLRTNVNKHVTVEVNRDEHCGLNSTKSFSVQKRMSVIKSRFMTVNERGCFSFVVFRNIYHWLIHIIV